LSDWGTGTVASAKHSGKSADAVEEGCAGVIAHGGAAVNRLVVCSVDKIQNRAAALSQFGRIPQSTPSASL
jgi:hypothetical protein